jgi:membrane dipeptidase
MSQLNSSLPLVSSIIFVNLFDILLSIVSLFFGEHLKSNIVVLIAVASFLLASCAPLFKSTTADDELRGKARELAHKYVIVDAHLDLPENLTSPNGDITRRADSGHFDYVRAHEGGLSAPFFAVYTPPDMEKTGGSFSRADSLIYIIDSLEIKYPDKFAISRSPRDVMENFKKDKISVTVGMENGAPIEGKLENVRHFFNRGVRYITLCHGKVNHISDSSFDTVRVWNGISPFGKDVISEMNRYGMMIDISHSSDSASFQAIKFSQAPVIASHTGARHFIPGFERNVSDDLIKALAEKGGIVMVNFGTWFVNYDFYLRNDSLEKAGQTYLRDHHVEESDSTYKAYMRQYRKAHPRGNGTVRDIADHIDYVAKLVGVDFVGFGSDFEGVGTVPVGIEDVSKYPNLIYELLKKGYSESDIEKICGKNFLRVWSAIEDTAKRLNPSL